MKKIIFWLDLAVCSIWTLAICGSRMLFGSYVAAALLFIVVSMRLTFSFLITRNEKRALLPLVITLAGWTYLISIGCDYGVYEMMHYPFYIFNMDFNRAVGLLLGLFTWSWLFLLPMVAYIMQFCRKRLERTECTWKDICGDILLSDHKARTYSAIMIVAVASLFAGLGMSMRTCLFMCVVAPTLTYWLLCRHYGAIYRKAWVIAIGMLVFFGAGQTAGAVRIALLMASFASVVYVCTSLYKATKSYVITVCAILFIGVMLPSISIGYNQYTCLNYARKGFYPAVPYNGVFYITDSTGELYGLRDRYKIILNPVYERIESSHRGSGFWCAVFETSKDGYTRVYDATNNCFMDDCTIDNLFQDTFENHNNK